MSPINSSSSLPSYLAPVLPSNFPALWATAWGEDAYGYWQSFEIKGIRQIMRWIIPGEFLMGSPENEAQRSDDEKQHKVIIEHGFWLADTTCTQELWQAVMGDNPSDFKESIENPVDSVSWNDCQMFIQKANDLLETSIDNKAAYKAGKKAWLSLPSEAAWEYACRAGTTTPFSFGENITTEQANYDGNYPYQGREVKGEKGIYREKTVLALAFPPNPWGLFQMHGNVLEWCQDIYEDNYSGEMFEDDSRSGSQRVLRGGNWINDARDLRSANRNASSPDYRDRIVGLRLAGGLTHSRQ